MNNPKVSVIIPVFNREHLIKRSMQSVLNQTYENLEVIVVNDASTDKTEEEVKSIKDERVRYIKNDKNLGPSVSRNKGIEVSKGELIAFQDSDDEWYEDKLQKQVDLIINSSEKVGAAYCGMEFIDFNTGEKTGESVKEADFKKNFTEGSFFLTPANVTVLIKKKVLDEVGYFDDRLYAQEDTEIAIRVSKKYDYAFVNEPLIRVTRNHKQLMGNSKNYILSREIIYEKHKNYLSKKILFASCKQIANYYILNKEYKKAKEYIKKALRHDFDLASLFQLGGLTLAPSVVDLIYSKKYKKGMPLSSGLKSIDN